MLKLIGADEKASGTVQLFPLNGESQSYGAVQVHEMMMETGTWNLLPMLCISMKIYGDMSNSFGFKVELFQDYYLPYYFLL